MGLESCSVSGSICDQSVLASNVYDRHAVDALDNLGRYSLCEELGVKDRIAYVMVVRRTSGFMGNYGRKYSL